MIALLEGLLERISARRRRGSDGAVPWYCLPPGEERLRAALAAIRSIEEYLKGRPCTCSGVGCVQCIARVALEGGELYS